MTASRPAPLSPIAIRRYVTSGLTVVVLHGGPGAPGSAAPLARALGRDFSVLEPLQRRSGEVALTVERHVLDLAEVAPPHAALVGHSWGAMLALSFASRFPERVSSIALVGCGTYDPTTRASYRAAMEARLGPERCAHLDELDRRLDAEVDAHKRDELRAQVGAMHVAVMAFDPVADAAEADVEVDERGHEETWQDCLRLQREGIEPAAFAAIHAPVIMLHGDDDPHPGPATHALLRRWMPQLEYVGFPRCGHEPWTERHARDTFLAALRAWLMRHSDAGPG